MRFLLLIILLALAAPAWGANAFVDYGQSGDGSAYNNASATLLAMMEASRTAGDTIFVCRTHEETLAATIDPISDGTAAAPIVVVADDGTHWPDSTGTPTLTCNASYIYANTDDYWHIDGLAFDTYTLYCIYWRNSRGSMASNCTFTNPAAATDYAIYANGASGVVVDCVFDGNAIGSDGTNNGSGLYTVNQGHIFATGCTFDGFADAIEGTSGLIRVSGGSFGQTEANTTDATMGSVWGGSEIQMYNCTLTDMTKLSGTAWMGELGCYWRDGSHRPAFRHRRGTVILEQDYDTVNSGGGEYSIKLTAASEVGTTNPAQILDYSVDCDSAEVRTYVVAVRRDTNWGTAPTAATLYLEVTYQGDGVTSTSTSTAVLTNADTWYDLSVADVSPFHAGPVQITLWLKAYDSTGRLYIDPRLTATGEEYRETFHWGTPSLAYFYTAPSGGQIIIISGG